jgi:hypothetical protein
LSGTKYHPDEEANLVRNIWDERIADNPYNFAMYVYPWGVAGTPLESFKGPRKWQKEEMLRIAEHIQANKQRMANGENQVMYRLSIASGRGPGKSAFLSMIGHWAMSTRPGCTVIYTANTESQLKSRTWAEYGKWLNLAINEHWFEKTATTVKPAGWFADSVKRDLKIDLGYYYAQAQLWSEENPDAFAGVHNPHGIFVIYDEASGIPKPIWTVTEGFYTEPFPDRYWFCMSNPRRNTGGFFECFHKHRNFWNTRHIDSRTVEGTDPSIYEAIIQQHGADSDPARVEVYGQFPRTGDKQFISTATVRDAAEREPVADEGAPLIMGVDVARFGDDSSVIRFRRGRDAKSIPPVVYKQVDNMTLANYCAELIDQHQPDAVCVDSGNGTGVIDRLREMGYRVHEVMFGGGAESHEWANRRTEMWARMRDWLPGGSIDDMQELVDDLSGPEYSFAGRDGDRIILEPKEQMKKRGLSSPDHGDALALTFAVRVPRRDRDQMSRHRGNRVVRGVDYDIFG